MGESPYWMLFNGFILLDSKPLVYSDPFIWSSPLLLSLGGGVSLDGWLSLVEGAPLEMGQCSSHSRVQIPVRPVPWPGLAPGGPVGLKAGGLPGQTDGPAIGQPGPEARPLRNKVE